MSVASNFEYTFVWVGGDNGRPWGTKAEMFSEAPHLDLSDAGIDLQNIVIDTGEQTGSNVLLSIGTTLTAGSWSGAELRLGTPTVPLGGQAEVVSNTANTLTVTWIVPAAGAGTFQGYLVRANDARKTYPSVRVLVPYQPEGPGASASRIDYPTPFPGPAPFVPGFSVPATLTTFEDVGLFLPFTFLEGIASHGVSRNTDSYSAPVPHVPDTPSASTFVILAGSGDNLVASSFAGGYIHVTHASGESWARIQDNTSSTFTLDVNGWQGVGLPTGTPANWDFTAWVPHYGNNPHSYLPGAGFRYPTNDMQPAVFGDGKIHNKPRGVTTFSYGDRAGSMLEFGWRMSVALGRRVNIIHLAVNDATLTFNPSENLNGFKGTLGWWDYKIHGDWALTTPSGLVSRIQKMINTIAPNALTAEGNTNPMRILGIVTALGDPDALVAGARENYSRALKGLIACIRDTIRDGGFSPYSTSADIPVVHPSLPLIPFESDGNDESGLVNAGLREVTASDAFATSVLTDDSPQITGDTEHFNGVGEAQNGELMALAMGELVDDALEYGSAILTTTNNRAVEICNLALSHIGDVANVVSIDPPDVGSRQASLCAQFYPEARDSLLQLRPWGFALRRRRLEKSVATTVEWDFAYVVPAEALKILAVNPPDASDDYSQPFIGRGFNVEPKTSFGGQYIQQDFAVERSPAGYRILYTDQDNAVLRYVARVVDASTYPHLFVLALSWHLASMLAGPIIKNEDGAKMTQFAASMTDTYVRQAADSDAQQRSIHPKQNVPWIAGR